MVYTIDKKKCMRCGTCDVECPFHAVVISDEGEFSINPEICKGCGVCLSVCPVDAPKKEENTN